MVQLPPKPYLQGAPFYNAVIPPEGVYSSAIALSPDARSILYVQADQVQSEIMVVENFR